jgi:hypothetical protein
VKLPPSQGDSLPCEHAPYLSIELAGDGEPQKPSASSAAEKCEAVREPPVETEGLACEIPKRELWERGESKNPLRQNGNRLSPNERRSEVPVREAVPTRGCKTHPLLVQSMGKPKFRGGGKGSRFPPPRNSHFSPVIRKRVVTLGVIRRSVRLPLVFLLKRVVITTT